MTDERLQHLLQSAFPPAAGEGPSRDLWPLVVDRVQAPSAWSWLDVSLAAIVAILLVMFPKGLLLLTYHL
jgi:hypothetical protein